MTARSLPAGTSSGPSLGDWGVWSSTLVRGAGFPVHAVDRLADEDLAALADRCSDARSPEFQAAWRKTSDRCARELGEIARSKDFRLAVAWQNRRFLETAVDPFLRQLDRGGPGNAKRRIRERAVASYWQRYCTKNESIGFFGPVAWASVGAGPGGVTVTPGGQGLVDDATVYLERWPVEAVARKLEAQLDLRPWLRPRRSPLQPPTSGGLEPTAVEILRRADGALAARELARQLCQDPEFPLGTEQEVFDAFAELVHRRRLVWRLELPASTTAEDDLLAFAQSIDDEDVRSAAQLPVRRLIDARQALQRVWDDPVELNTELSRLEEAFAELTGERGTRHEGQAYGGRTLAYLECRRDVVAELGSGFLDALKPVTLVLDSIRWLTSTIRDALQPRILERFLAIRERGANAEVNAAAFWAACMATLGADLPAIVTESVCGFQLRWTKAIPEAEAAHVQYAYADLDEVVTELFDAPDSGWSQARMVCPDVMVAASSAECAAQGRFTLVLGEVHAAMNSLDYVSMVPRHRDAAALLREVDATFPEPRLLPVLPPESRPRFTARSHPTLIRQTDRRIVLLPHTPVPSSDRVEFAADAVIRDEAGALQVVLADGSRFDVMDLFAEAVKAVLVGSLELFPIRRHRPRITVDGLVLAREGWRVPVAAPELDFAALPEASERFVTARAWAREFGLPRRVFVKSPAETKPVYVDFASPVLAEAFAAGVRRARRDCDPDSEPALKITEMLPGPSECWLPDGGGADTYTSEFRFAMYDRREAPYRPRAERTNP